MSVDDTRNSDDSAMKEEETPVSGKINFIGSVPRKA
jgi:hypothetical protein